MSLSPIWGTTGKITAAFRFTQAFFGLGQTKLNMFIYRGNRSWIGGDDIKAVIGPGETPVTYRPSNNNRQDGLWRRAITRAKLALAKGRIKKYRRNTGVSPFLPEERKHTKRLIIQYNQDFKEEEVLRQADAIEINWDTGFRSGAAGLELPGLESRVPDASSARWKYVEEAMLLNVKTDDLAQLVKYLRKLPMGANRD